MSWKKLLKVLGAGALGGLLHAGMTATQNDNGIAGVLVPAIITAVAAHVNTDDKKDGQ